MTRKSFSFNGDESLVAYGASAFPPARRTSRVEGRGSTCQFPGSLVPPMIVPPLKKRGMIKLHVPSLFCLVTVFVADRTFVMTVCPRVGKLLQSPKPVPLALTTSLTLDPPAANASHSLFRSLWSVFPPLRLVLIPKLHAFGKLRGSVLAVPRQPSFLGKAGLGLSDIVRRRSVEELNARRAGNADRRLRPQQLLELSDRLLEPASLTLELGTVAGWDRADVSACPHGGVVGRVRDGRSRDGGWPFTRNEHDSGLGGGAGEEGLDLEGGRETDDSGAGAWSARAMTSRLE
ncbi:unnamed protein product [Clonostachys chloroleuca]|uniref:Uncharacterized protein n=1 Tax=Clonostachys chloroleuca TaxID=1926264 RepID=A0AA35LT92_9HYPO|nr:unnamed protein product [Clonostachys chloroleuca]